MIALTHMAAGALAGYILSAGHPPETALLLTGISTLGALLPDIDVGTSKIAGFCRPAAYTIQFLFGHRGICHSLLLWAVLLLLWHRHHPNLALCNAAVACGILSHLILDLFNPSGIPLLWPIPIRIHLGIFRTGGLFDWILGILLTCAVLHLLTTNIFPSIAFLKGGIPI